MRARSMTTNSSPRAETDFQKFTNFAFVRLRIIILPTTHSPVVTVFFVAFDR
jgi:hypothetical protein